MNKHELKLLAISLVALATVADNKKENEKYNHKEESKKEKSKTKGYLKLG